MLIWRVKNGSLSLATTVSDNERIFPLIYWTIQAVCPEVLKSFISLLRHELPPTNILCPVNSVNRFIFYDRSCSILLWLMLLWKHMGTHRLWHSRNLTWSGPGRCVEWRGFFHGEGSRSQLSPWRYRLCARPDVLGGLSSHHLLSSFLLTWCTSVTVAWELSSLERIGRSPPILGPVRGLGLLTGGRTSESSRTREMPT